MKNEQLWGVKCYHNMKVYKSQKFFSVEFRKETQEARKKGMNEQNKEKYITKHK